MVDVFNYVQNIVMDGNKTKKHKDGIQIHQKSSLKFNHLIHKQKSRTTPSLT